MAYGKFSEISRSRVFGEIAESIVFTVFSFYEKVKLIFSARFQFLLTMHTVAAASANFNAVCAASRLTLSESTIDMLILIFLTSGLRKRH